MDRRRGSWSPQASGLPTLSPFTAASAQDAERDVLACCASAAFAKAIAGGRPYLEAAALMTAVDRAFDALNWNDIVDGMNAHPRIGDRPRSTGWSAAEQSGAAAASDQVRQRLAERNRAYAKHFGHILPICASGLSREEIRRR